MQKRRSKYPSPKLPRTVGYGCHFCGCPSCPIEDIATSLAVGRDAATELTQTLAWVDAKYTDLKLEPESSATTLQEHVANLFFMKTAHDAEIILKLKNREEAIEHMQEVIKELQSSFCKIQGLNAVLETLKK